jgi:hypothetical protein
MSDSSSSAVDDKFVDKFGVSLGTEQLGAVGEMMRAGTMHSIKTEQRIFSKAS